MLSFQPKILAANFIPKILVTSQKIFFLSLGGTEYEITNVLNTYVEGEEIFSTDRPTDQLTDPSTDLPTDRQTDRPTD